MRKIVLIAILIFLLSLTPVYAKTLTSTIDLPAVTSEGNGILSQLEVEIKPGKGRVLLTISPYTGIQTQNSEIIAVNVARKYTDFDFDNHDVIFTINAANANSVDGPSAGAAMAVAVIAAVEEKEIRTDASITGTIQLDGTIGAVGGIMEKAQAAAESGDTLFIIPDGESKQPVLVEKIEEPAPGWIIKRMTTEYIDISKTLQDEYGITIAEVKTIKDATDILLNGKDVAEEEVVIEEIEIVERQIGTLLTQPMENLATWQIEDTEQVKSDLLQSIFSEVDEQLSKAKQAKEKGYLYGAANYAFRGGISAKYVRDLATFYALNEEDQMKFVGDKITEITENLDRAKKDVIQNEHLATDVQAYEWAISAQQRIAQAVSQLDEKAETSEGILYSISTIESWTGIANNFIKIAKELESKKIVDVSSYENKSESALSRANAEVKQFEAQDGYGADWYITVAEREYEADWFVPAYIDASIASMRIETVAEINSRGWSDLVSYIDTELDEVDISRSAWGKLYRDYGNLVLQEAKNELNVEKLKEALIYARQAKIYSEISNDYAILPEARFGKYNWVLSKIVIISAGVLVIIIGLTFMNRGIHKSFTKK
jgi:predicted S18 family serine protease